MARFAEATFVFANLAGAARGENCNPAQLGIEVATLVHDSRGETLVAGLSEVIVAGLSPHEVDRSSGNRNPLPLHAHVAAAALDDLSAFRSGFQSVFSGAACTQYYLSHIDSQRHHHDDAVEGKWEGESAARRLREQRKQERVVYQGTAAVFFARTALPPIESALGVQLRKAGLDPDANQDDDPMEFKGNRDSEPRTALIFQNLRLADDLSIHLAFCQLETNSKDKRTGTSAEMDGSPGFGHRTDQLNALATHLSSSRPTVLMGDFNARPGSTELDHFCDDYKFTYVLPDEDKEKPMASGTWGSRYTFDERPIAPPNPERKESQQQGWRFSHLVHEILIDLALVHGLDKKEFDCKLRLLEVPAVVPGERLSDHRPIVLTISRKG